VGKKLAPFWARKYRGQPVKPYEFFTVVLARLMSKLWIFVIVATVLAVSLVAYAIAWSLKTPR
jgi:hypothetical protein